MCFIELCNQERNQYCNNIANYITNTDEFQRLLVLAYKVALQVLYDTTGKFTGLQEKEIIIKHGILLQNTVHKTQTVHKSKCNTLLQWLAKETLMYECINVGRGSTEAHICELSMPSCGQDLQVQDFSQTMRENLCPGSTQAEIQMSLVYILSGRINYM